MTRDEARSLLRGKFVLFSVEGAAEAVVMESLIAHDVLVVPFERLVSDSDDPTRYYTRTRKARDIADRYFKSNYYSDGADGLLIARIVDTSSAKFELPKKVRDDATVLSFYTKPEIEMLAIHREGAFKEWGRESRRNRSLRPNEFCKANLGMKDIKETNFLRGYWSDCDELVKAIREYARTSSRRRDELFLADLLK